MGQSKSNHDSCFCGTSTISISHIMFTTASPSPYNFSQLILGLATRIPAMLFLRMHSNINKTAQKCSVPLETVVPMILAEQVVNALWSFWILPIQVDLDFARNPNIIHEEITCKPLQSICVREVVGKERLSFVFTSWFSGRHWAPRGKCSRGEVPLILGEYGSVSTKPLMCLLEVELWFLNVLKRAAQWEAEESAEEFSSWGYSCEARDMCSKETWVNSCNKHSEEMLVTGLHCCLGAK